MRRILAYLAAVSVLLTSFALVSSAADDFEIYGSHTSVYRGENTDLTVSVKGNPGAVAFRIGLTYDSKAMSLVSGSLKYADGFSDGTSVENEKIEGTLYSAWIHTSNVSDNGEIFTVSFKVADDARAGEYPVEISVSAYTDENGVRHTPTITNGSIEAKRKPSSGSAPFMTVVDDKDKEKNEAPFEDGDAVTEDNAITPKFTDLPDGAYYYDSVLWALERGITSGMTEHTFEPETVCTRAQAVTFLYRLCEASAEEATMVFDDVPEDSYYRTAVLWALNHGITAGTSERTFSPDATVTRGQLVTFLWRLAGKPSAEGVNFFEDVKQDSYCFDAVLWALDKGITSGMTETSFAPDLPCTRGQIVTFLNRYADADRIAFEQ